MSLEDWKPDDDRTPIFGLDRTGEPTRFTLPLPQRSLWRRIADAWAGAVEGWKWGGQ